MWLAPVELPPGYTLKARAFSADGTPIGDVAAREAPPAGAAHAVNAGAADAEPRLAHLRLGGAPRGMRRVDEERVSRRS